MNMSLGQAHTVMLSVIAEEIFSGLEMFGEKWAELIESRNALEAMHTEDQAWYHTMGLLSLAVGLKLITEEDETFWQLGTRTAPR